MICRLSTNPKPSYKKECTASYLVFWNLTISITLVLLMFAVLQAAPTNKLVSLSQIVLPFLTSEISGLGFAYKNK